MRSKAVRLILWLWTACLTAVAAEPAPKLVQLRFVSMEQSLRGIGLAGADGKATPLVITADALSRPVRHPLGPVRLVSLPQPAPARKKAEEPLRPEDTPPEVPGFRKKKSPATPERVKAGDHELGMITLPAGDHQRFIILVHPGKARGMTAIPDRLGSFPPGSDRYVNLAGQPVIIDIPAGRQFLPADGSIVLRPGAAHLRPYQLRLLTKTANEEKLVFSAFTAQDDERRNLRILLAGGPEGDGIVLKSISDGLAAEDNYR